ncbi:dihydroorotase, multifunctional complex type [Proteiniborus sp. DW1]|uniref:dihydroorotase n=1 Tax=Proteiniborus sp. DW1 TaxID=1889883 RepID=UPI00092E1610|nr:dihydroorotase [Proteiniborus sp. DW1]SCG82506.1 dihydroorotase, multifunctional complex type [Proteiniborus sp. DW1]
MELLIKGTRVIDSDKDCFLDVYINNGIIERIDSNIQKNCKTIRAEGLILLPSFIDMHCHFREPGFEYKEDLLTGSHSALRGGFTAVNLMANTKPVCSSMETVEYVLDKSKKIGMIDVHQCVSITDGFNGISTAHLDSIDDRVKIISDDGNGVENNVAMLEAMLKAAEKNLIVMSHAENREISKYDTRLSENIMTSRDIELAEKTNARLHIAHVSTKEALKYIVEGKKKGLRITCEVTPHHIALDDSTKYTVNPPLRTDEDKQFLIKGIKNGWVDVIATDHAPHSQLDKEKGAPGISGLETAFSVCFTGLVKEGHISLKRLSDLMSNNPAKLMGLNKGQIKEGFDGDLILVDIERMYEINSYEFASKGKNTPFNGKRVWGSIEATIKAGRIVYMRKELDYDNR